jgi:hypothetical protein
MQTPSSLPELNEVFFSVSGVVPECEGKMAANDDQAGR